MLDSVFAVFATFATTIYIILLLLIWPLMFISAGRALAKAWRPAREIVVVSLAFAFPRCLVLVWAFGFSWILLLQDFAQIFIVVGLSYRVTRARQMVRQYYWLYTSRWGPLSWRERPAGSAGQ